MVKQDDEEHREIQQKRRTRRVLNKEGVDSHNEIRSLRPRTRKPISQVEDTEYGKIIW